MNDLCTTVNAKAVLANSGVKFGTSGARGLVTDFTPDVCAAFAHAFVAALGNTAGKISHIALAMDNRPSSYAMAQACAAALQQLNIVPIFYGVIPTPALAYVAMQDSMPCIMVTGSHIPFDRNGLKFYRADGEITKSDEIAINQATVEFQSIEESILPDLITDPSGMERYGARYQHLFNSTWLAGKRIGIYEHSSAGRDLYESLFKALGAEVIALERSDEFVPIDTEAVSEEDQQKAAIWSQKYAFDMIFSTDGDGDRPLIADETGKWLRGDILGLLTAQALQIDALAVPVSCNTAIEQSDFFSTVKRTKIGSPYVIAEFETLKNAYSSVAGFEANGGFLLGSDMVFEDKKITALPTRDALLPAFMLLALSINKSITISELLHTLPERYTASDRLQNFPREKSLAIVQSGQQTPEELLGKLGIISGFRSIDTTDGLRLTLDNSDIVHLRPSGNAPELRCYVDSDSYSNAVTLVNDCLLALA